ncbi:MAG: glycosyltransferase [Verrucomicrobia bacterium]|nr:glycosyltransferase [Verrucomicrobiota bacterium]
MPAVSVLMVTHRVTPFLRAAVASVFAQTLGDLELVLVDNGAGLKPEDLGEAGRDPRLRLMVQPGNGGIPAGHNAGVAAARGEFIALLDHDDVMLPVRLERQVARLRADPALGLVSSLAESIDGSGRVIGREFALVEADSQRRYSEFAAPVVTPAYTGRREVFAALPYRAAFAFTADFDFLARAAERYAMAGVPEVLLQYRHHAAQTTVERAGRISRERCVVRLLAARRRAGRDEGTSWPALLAAEPESSSQSAMLGGFGERFLAEGFAAQAAFHARRSFVVHRTPGTLAAASGLAWRAWRSTHGGGDLVVRMFVSGPVRALGLRPA